MSGKQPIAEVSETSDAAKAEDTQPQKASDDSSKTQKMSFWTPKRLEMVVAILLGIATLLSAWASWIGSLHSGIQAIHFTESNNVAARGTAEYNACLQMYLSDSMAWMIIKDSYDALAQAKKKGDQVEYDQLKVKIDIFKEQNLSSLLHEGLEWMEQNGKSSPFEMPGITDKYFATAQDSMNQSQELMREGQRDNTKGDAFNLVSVIYSLVLFLLGIVGIFKELPNRVIIMLIAAFGLVFATIYMCTIPLPTGFNPLNFFAIK